MLQEIGIWIGLLCGLLFSAVFLYLRFNYLANMKIQMLDRIKQIDTELLIFLNNLGNKSWDPLWVSITDKFTFLPLFILIIFFLFKKNGTKGLLVILLFISVLILFTDQFTNVVKDFTQRLRPCRLDELQGLLRDIDIGCGKYGFFSAHAANSISITIFVINCVDESVKKNFKTSTDFLGDYFFLLKNLFRCSLSS